MAGRCATLTEEEHGRIELEQRLGTMDAIGIARTVIIAGHGYLRPDGLADTRAVNDRLAAYRDRTPDRFAAAVGVVEPLYGERGLAEIDRCRDELGMAALSFHTRYQGVSLDSPWVRRYVEHMGTRGLVAYVHALADSAEEALWKVDTLAGDLPDVTFLVLSSFTNFEQPRLALQIARRRPNTYWDTGGAYAFKQFLPLIKEVGAGRVAFGSDLYSWPNTIWSDHMLREIRQETELSDEDRAEILGGTVGRILGLSA